MSVPVLVERCWTRCKSPPCGDTAVVDKILTVLLLIGAGVSSSLMVDDGGRQGLLTCVLEVIRACLHETGV